MWLIASWYRLLKGKPDYEDALSGNVAAAAKVAGQLGADIIVIGTAKVSSGGKVYSMTSGQADINGKIVRVDTGEDSRSGSQCPR